MAQLREAFRTTGVLTKVTGCHGAFCMWGSNLERAHEWLWEALGEDTIPPDVDRDCGPRCSAFSFLNADTPVTPFGWSGYMSGFMLVFEANEELWQHVQCMAVSDCFTSTRVCCTCSDLMNCPYNGFGQNYDLYCDEPCTDETCMQLAAGCGVSLFDLAGKANGGDGSHRIGRSGQTQWNGHHCSKHQVASGSCGMCEQPYWCDDQSDATHAAFGPDAGRITTAVAWADEFYNRDGGTAYGARQCRWKRSQKDTFVASIRERYRRRKRDGLNQHSDNHDHMNQWNEVNMYVDTNGQLAHTLWDSLLGLVFVRTAGNEYERQKMRELARHWRRLGHEIPTFEMSAEPVNGDILHWREDERVDLLQPPYSLVELPPLGDGEEDGSDDQ